MKNALIAVVLVVCLSLLDKACARNPGNMAKTSVHDENIIVEAQGRCPCLSHSDSYSTVAQHQLPVDTWFGKTQNYV
uniref:Secreted protein n=1 Tax=Panagrellus redivivus TaxID=6233 RepID=A0A7E4UNL2_PANRE